MPSYLVERVVRRLGTLAAVSVSIGTVVPMPDQSTLSSGQTLTGYGRAVGLVCDHALLFTSRHEIGTRAGALAVSRDIRATGKRRLQRVEAIPKPPGRVVLATRWIAVERRLVGTYARTYLRIWLAIENARTPSQRAALPRVLRKLVRVPDLLAGRAGILEAQLRVPDCTGGTVRKPR
jgi:hypothetical protein